MPESKDEAEVVTAPAVEPVKEAPVPDEMPVETEDSFVDEAIGPVPAVPEAAVTEEEAPEATPEPEAPTVAPEEKKEEVAEPEKPEVKETELKAPEVKVETETKVSRLDRRLADKYAENLVLKGVAIPSSEQIEAELASMNLEEKKNALRNLLDENRTIRGQKPEALSHEDEEAIIEAEVDRRYQIEQQAVFNRQFQEDLAATLAAHPELDKRTEKYNPKIEKAIIPMVQSGMLVSEAYAIVQDAIKTAKEEQRKANEIAAQQSMSGAVIAPPVSEVVNKDPVTDEDKFLADALGT